VGAAPKFLWNEWELGATAKVVSDPLGNGMGRASVNFDICGEAAMVLFALSIAGTRNAAPNPALVIKNCLLVQYLRQNKEGFP
jgi:hypothetical protein